MASFSGPGPFMPIDVERGFVFVHIPRTGGSSIECMLDLLRPQNLFSPTPVPWHTPADKTPQHFTWRELKRNLPAAFANRAFRFCVVRNPWDRFLSEFLWRRFLRDRPGRRPTEPLYSGSYLESLEAFVRVLDVSDDHDLRRGLDGHLQPQRSFVIDDDGSLAMTAVARFEQFALDVGAIFRRLGIQQPVTSHVSRSQRLSDYRPYYSCYSRDAVEAFYRDDVAYFGYRF